MTYDKSIRFNCKGFEMKTITNYRDDKFVQRIDITFKALYYHIKKYMPFDTRWIVDTGKRKRLYFWFYGNVYQGNQLCWTNIK